MENEIVVTAATEQIVSFFNSVAGTEEACTPEVVGILNKIEAVLNPEEIKSRIKKAVSESELNKKISVCLFNIFSEFSQEKMEERVKAATGMSFLGDVVSKTLAQTATETIREEVIKDLRHICDEFLVKNYGKIVKNIEFQVGDNVVNPNGEVVHKKFETVLKFCNMKTPVFLVGPAGSGKNVICKQVAKALGIPFYFSNAVTQEYKITGFTDAMGVFHETQFYKAFKNGGLFFLDEIDASVPEVLVILNAAIANGYFDFPAPIGYVEAHPDFRVVAAGNTYGYGASMEYVGRNQIDAATLDRFALVNIDYDEDIEMAVANNDTEIVKFAHDLRKACEKSGIRFVVSYRGIEYLAKMKEVLPLDEAVKTCIFKGMSAEDARMVLGEFHGDFKYREILESLGKE